MSLRILFLIPLFCGCLSGAKLKCKFPPGGIGYSAKVYYCKVVDNGIFNGSRVTIDGIEDTHLANKTNEDVDAIEFDTIAKLNYFPRNIEKFFNNLKGIYVFSSNLQEITQDDLKPFPQLIDFSLSDNKVTTINANLFKYNPELKVIFLRFNKISYIDPNVFDDLEKLERLWLSENNCKQQFKDAFTRTEVLKSLQTIQKGECT